MRKSKSHISLTHFTLKISLNRRIGSEGNSTLLLKVAAGGHGGKANSESYVTQHSEMVCMAKYIYIYIKKKL